MLVAPSTGVSVRQQISEYPNDRLRMWIFKKSAEGMQHNAIR